MFSGYTASQTIQCIWKVNFQKKSLEGYYYFLTLLIAFGMLLIFTSVFIQIPCCCFFPILCILIFKCNYYTRDALMKTSNKWCGSALIMQIRIHKIWWMRTRIQVNKIIKLFSNLCLKLGKTWKILFPTKKKRPSVELFFPLHFIPSFYGSGSGSTDPNECGSIRIHITASISYIVIIRLFLIYELGSRFSLLQVESGF